MRSVRTNCFYPIKINLFLMRLSWKRDGALDSPKLLRRLPSVLSREEILAMLDWPLKGERLGFRDRTMLELLYACGLRVSELTGLDLSDFDAQAGLLRILGKGSKERLVPVHDSAI